MSKVVNKGAGTPAFNLTPMIDVTFQLIIFFMLVNNIVAEESVTLVVPKLFEPKVVELNEKQERITINVIPPDEASATDRMTKSDPLKIFGEPRGVKVGLNTFGMDQLDQMSDDLKSSVQRNEQIVVLLRADASTPYEHMQPVMAAITRAGIKVVHLVAFMPEEGPPAINEK